MLGAGLTVLAYEEYSSSKVAGAFFAAFGLGAVLGSIAAVRIVGRHDPLRLGASAFVIAHASDLRALARAAGAGRS